MNAQSAFDRWYPSGRFIPEGCSGAALAAYRADWCLAYSRETEVLRSPDWMRKDFAYLFSALGWRGLGVAVVMLIMWWGTGLEFGVSGSSSYWLGAAIGIFTAWVAVDAKQINEYRPRCMALGSVMGEFMMSYWIQQELG